jgi:hypothetical protein
MGKLVHWQLAELQPNKDDPKRKTSGLWRPTADGVAFVHERIRVPARVYLYDNEPIGFDSEQITIREALGDRFDYQELMEG